MKTLALAYGMMLGWEEEHRERRRRHGAAAAAPLHGGRRRRPAAAVTPMRQPEQHKGSSKAYGSSAMCLWQVT
jgi:hypothetical protein